MRKHFSYLFYLVFLTLNAQNNTFPTSGNVGIGTISPASKLDVDGDTFIGKLDQRHYLKISSKEWPEVRFQTPLSDEQIRMGVAHGAFSQYDVDEGDFYVWSQTVNKMPLIVKRNGNVTLNTLSGNVGIGTSSPTSKLDIVGGNGGWTNPTLNLKSSATNAWSLISLVGGNFDSTGDYMIGRGNSGFNNGRALTLHIPSRSSFYGGSGNLPEISFVSSGSVKLGSIQSETGNWYMRGNVGIGTTTPDEKLTVKGKIHTEEVKVDLSVPGPDYVFEEEYDLKSLEEIEAFIKSNKHLPEVPTAKEMEENGVELGVMNMLLLKKIEELTLHLIQQQSINNQLASRLEKLEKLQK